MQMRTKLLMHPKQARPARLAKVAEAAVSADLIRIGCNLCWPRRRGSPT
jgi:hypothetical protein